MDKIGELLKYRVQNAGYRVLTLLFLYDKIDYDMKVALVVGSEGKGISSLVLKNADFITKIPMVGHVNSLNASVATGIYLAMIQSKRK